MVSEREKMLRGELYDAADGELVAARSRTRDLVLGVIAHGEPINPVRLTAALLILAGITLMKSASDVNS
jgi:hypothetical protein